MKPLPTVFLCYARSDNEHKDQDLRWLDRVRLVLKPYVQRRQIRVFHDNNVSAGTEWDARLMKEAAECDVAILLISSAFLGSDYIRERELPVLLKRWRAKEILLLPLLLSPCNHDDVAYKFPDPETGPDEICLSAIEHVGDLKNALIDLNPGGQAQRLKTLAREVIDHIRGTGSGSASTEAAPAKSPNTARRGAASRRSAVPGQPTPAPNSGVQISGGVHAAPGSGIQISGENGTNIVNQSHNTGSFNNARDSFNQTRNVIAIGGGIAVGGNVSRSPLSTGKKTGRRAGPA